MLASEGLCCMELGSEMVSQSVSHMSNRNGNGLVAASGTCDKRTISPNLQVGLLLGYQHHLFYLTTGQQPLLMRDLHRERSSASSFNFQYSLFSLRSSSTCLRLLPRLSVTSPLSFHQQRVLEAGSYVICDQSSQPSFFLLFIGYSSSLDPL